MFVLLRFWIKLREISFNYNLVSIEIIFLILIEIEFVKLCVILLIFFYFDIVRKENSLVKIKWYILW